MMTSNIKNAVFDEKMTYRCEISTVFCVEFIAEAIDHIFRL